MSKINEITKRLSEVSLTISRVPLNTKRDFISLANAEFEGDYGMVLKVIFDQFIEYQNMKALFFDKLENIENKLDVLMNKPEEKTPKFRRLGKRIESEGGNKDGEFKQIFRKT